jgi:hypothetical protein
MRQHRLHWLRWRRMHQDIAQRCHLQRRQRQGPTSSSIAEVFAPALPGLGPVTEVAWLQIASLLLLPVHLGRPIVAHRTLLEAML